MRYIELGSLMDTAPSGNTIWKPMEEEKQVELISQSKTDIKSPGIKNTSSGIKFLFISTVALIGYWLYKEGNL